MVSPITRKLLYDPQKNPGKPMRVAGFMSGSGTNIRKILEKQRELQTRDELPPYKVVALFSDVKDPKKCKIREIAKEFNLEYKIKDIWDFYRSQGHTSKRDLSIRKEYDKSTLAYLREKRVDCIALGGYMSIVTEVIFENIPTINVHPADLSILDEASGKRKYTGDHAVRDAILAGESEIRSSTHIVTAEVDGGPLLLISKPVQIELPPSVTIESLKEEKNRALLEEIADLHQNKLKEVGDWLVLPTSLIYIAQGRVAIDEKGKVYIDGVARPSGLKL
ncbi:MAG: phosphoribosylglycinamide formyltransferase [Candidatus Helarchaeota archaeon]